MYQRTHTLASDLPLDLIPEVCFAPDGAVFAATFQGANEVVIFDAATRATLRTYSNPEAGLDDPHGVVLTDRYMIISNTHGKLRPSTLVVYNLADSASTPASSFATPFPFLREAHSLTLHDDVLVVSYCQNGVGTGAIVSYGFDRETGRITGALDIRQSYFGAHGDPKGVAFNSEGTLVYCTYASQKRQTGLANQRRRIKAARIVWQERSLFQFFAYVWSRITKRARQLIGRHRELRNGIAAFAISKEGKFSERPVKALPRKAFCRLENIAIVGNTAVLSDTINGKVFLHDLENDPELSNPGLTISDSLILPHGAKLSPDQSMLVVTNYGLKVENQVIHWLTPAPENGNRIVIYDRQADTPVAPDPMLRLAGST